MYNIVHQPKAIPVVCYCALCVKIRFLSNARRTLITNLCAQYTYTDRLYLYTYITYIRSCNITILEYAWKIYVWLLSYIIVVTWFTRTFSANFPVRIEFKNVIIIIHKRRHNADIFMRLYCVYMCTVIIIELGFWRHLLFFFLLVKNDIMLAVHLIILYFVE